MRLSTEQSNAIRIYEFEWHKNERNPITRHCRIQISKPAFNVSIDAKNAVDLFTKNFGNLKKNTIVKIKELNGSGDQIGEDIIPTEENNIIPIG